MDELKLPEELKGNWNHALLLSYGMDVPFFENALWSQFSTNCRLKIILADGQKYLEALDGLARSGLARHLNQRYIAAGVFGFLAAHAKLILLTHSERGRLLVGSGNLSLQGYASGGELFTRYAYDEESPEQLAAFLTVRELLEELLERGAIERTARRYLRQMLENTPWLYQPSPNPDRPVRHNLEHNFIDQLADLTGEDQVEALWVLSPFYDPGAVALAKLLERLQPRITHLLVQPGRTSVALPALQRVIAATPGQVQVHVFRRQSGDPYVHAKLYLLQFRDRALCLQGSPNLSQVAMLRSGKEANLELGNLLQGARDAFDPILDALQIEPEVADLDMLDLRYDDGDRSDFDGIDGWLLSGGEWQGKRLYLYYRHRPANERAPLLLIGDQSYKLPLKAAQAGRMTFRLTPEAAARLQEPVPIRLRWEDEQGFVRHSNPIFICNRKAIDDIINAPTSGETLPSISNLELGDDELEQLLADLDAALVLDRRSVWHLAGRRPPQTTMENDDEALHLSYADIDYDLLRHHPKVQQYRQRNHRNGHGDRSRLQIILNAITNNFQGLLDVADVVASLPDLTDEEPEAQTEEEREAEVAERQRRQQSRAERLRRLFKSFIKRYLRGLGSSDFQTFAGVEVMVTNYIVFSHLLWQLFRQEWFDPEQLFIGEALLQTWQLFWGDAEHEGYFETLDERMQAEALTWLREHRADARQLAAFYQTTLLAKQQDTNELRFALRNYWREFLQQPPFPLTKEVLKDTWYLVADLIRFEPPRPPEIIAELTALADFETENGFLRFLEERYSFPPASCYFETVYVRRFHFDNHVRARCLALQAPDSLTDQNQATSLLRHWMRFERRDYYRLASPTANQNDRLLFYEVGDGEGVYWNRIEGGDPVEIGTVHPARRSWDLTLVQLRTLASALEEEEVLPAMVGQPVTEGAAD